ncbi:MAG: DHA2 family efflux MFS transporter permease subunit [Acidobacteriota bacterium]
MNQTRKWLIAASVLFGTFLAVMDVAVVNVALPHMMGTFGESLSAITWVATSYSIAEIVMLTMAGWWSALLGRKRLYLLSFGLFSIGSALSGMSQTFGQMIFFRVIQGIGGGSLIPISQAILRETFPPEEQGMAMAVYGMGVVLAPGVAPVLGGWLTEQYGWPWVFYINIPFAIAGILMIATFVEDPPYLKRGVKQIDWTGIALLSIGLTSMQLVLERGEQENWFESDWIIAGTIVTLVALLLLVVQQFRSSEPVVNFRLLANKPLAVGSAMGLVFGIALYGTTFILPQFTQNLLGYSAFQAGLVLLPRVVTLFLLMPVAGWLYNRVDPRIMILFGSAIIIVSYYQLASLSLEVGFWNLVPMLLLMGAGMPFMFVTLSTVSLSSIPRANMTDASSLYTLARRIGGNLGYALVATIVERRTTIHRLYLSANVNVFNPAYESLRDQISALLGSLSFPQGQQRFLELLNHQLFRQARMIAYNDVSLVLGAMFVLVLPLIFLLPGQAVLRRQRQAETRRDQMDQG